MSLITPEQYMCYRAVEPLTIDGRLNEGSWVRAPRPPLFVDIAEPDVWGWAQFSASTVGEGEDQFSETPEPRPAPAAPWLSMR